MSGDRPDPTDEGRPVSGVAAGTAYFALPPTAVDARPAGGTRIVLAWPGFDPPRGATALAAAVPMTGVPTWRVYLELPESGAGFDSAALLENDGLRAYGTAVERAVEELPAVLAGIRNDLGVEDGPVGLAGFSVGGTVALHALARGDVSVSAAAAVAPIISPAVAARPMERRAGRERSWDADAGALADRLDLGTQVARIAGRGAPLLFVGGATDRVTPAREINALCDLLRQEGAGAVETTTFRMGHALAAEPGTDPQPPSTEAVRVDAALTDWFRERLAKVVPPAIEEAPADIEVRPDIVEAALAATAGGTDALGAGMPHAGTAVPDDGAGGGEVAVVTGNVIPGAVETVPVRGTDGAGSPTDTAIDLVIPDNIRGPMGEPPPAAPASGGEHDDQVRLSTW